MSRIDPLWVTAILFFSTAVFGTMSLALLSEVIRDWWRRRRVAMRLRPIVLNQSMDPGKKDVFDLVRPDSRPGSPEVLDTISNHVPGLRQLSTRMEQGRVDWGPWTFFVLSAGLALGCGGTVFLLRQSLFLGTLAAMAGAAGPYFYILRRQRARYKQFEEEFPEAIDLLTRAIRAGHPLSSGMRMVAEEGPPEAAEEFRRTFEEQRFGIPFEEALLGMVDRTDMVDVRIFAIAVLVQREVGGNLAEILDNLSTTIRRRFYLRRQLRTYTAQGRMTGYALAGMPPVLGFIIFLIQPEYMMVLFTNLLGWFLVGVALFLQVVGALWIKKIIAIDM